MSATKLKTVGVPKLKLMGIITAKNRGKNIYVELETHDMGYTNLQINKLGAVFLETSGLHPNKAQRIETLMNTSSTVIEKPGQHFVDNHGGQVLEKMKGIIEEAKRSGTEIWLGDIPSPRSSITDDRDDLFQFAAALGAGALGGGMAYAASKLVKQPMTRRTAIVGIGGLISAVFGFLKSSPKVHSQELEAPGDVTDRKISRMIVGARGKFFEPAVYVRNPIMAHKIKALMNRTKHHEIGGLNFRIGLGLLVHD